MAEISHPDLYVWCTSCPYLREHPDQLYAKCRVCPGSTPEVFKLQQVDPPCDGAIFEARQKDVYNYNYAKTVLSLNDIMCLPHPNYPACLDYIKYKYERRQYNLWVGTDHLKLAVHEDVEKESITRVRECTDPTRFPPHECAVLHRAFQLVMSGRSQVVYAVGDHGIARLVAHRQMAQYMTHLVAKSSVSVVERACSALTFLDYCSARFEYSSSQVRFYDRSYASVEYAMTKDEVVGFHISHVFAHVRMAVSPIMVGQEKRLRFNHLVAYILCLCAPADVREQLCLLPNISQYSCLDVSVTAEQLTGYYERLVTVYRHWGCSQEEIIRHFKVISVLIHMSCIRITTVQQPCVGTYPAYIDPSDRCLKAVSTLCGVSIEQVMTILLHDQQNACSYDECEQRRLIFVRNVYEAHIKEVVHAFNTCCPVPEDHQTCLHLCCAPCNTNTTRNGFRELLVNSASEYFTYLHRRVVKSDCQERLRDDQVYEHASCASFWKSDESESLRNYEKMNTNTETNSSVCGILCNSCCDPACTDEQFAKVVYERVREVVVSYDSTKLVVNHTTGEIEYQHNGFLYENRDRLRVEMLVPFPQNHRLFCTLRPWIVCFEPKTTCLRVTEFFTSFTALIRRHETCRAHYIYCCQPILSSCKKFSNTALFLRLHYSWFWEAIAIKRSYYSLHVSHQEFLAIFSTVFKEEVCCTTKTACEKVKSCVSRRQYSVDLCLVGTTYVHISSLCLEELYMCEEGRESEWLSLVDRQKAIRFTDRRCEDEIDAHQCSVTRVQAHLRQQFNKHPSFLA